jgi:hypothetical protein
MNVDMTVEIHFQQQDQVSIVLKHGGSPEDERPGELMIAVMLAIRVMSNLGVHQLTDTLATLLTDAPFRIKQFAVGSETAGVALVQHRGYPGRKRFLATVKTDGETGKFT